MTDQLRLYNAALLEIGERKLTALTDDVRGRHELDRVWDSGEIIDYFLQQGHWNFASRTSQFTFSPSITPPFRYQYAFSKPLDWVHTSAVSADEFFSIPLTDYLDEAEYWFAAHDTIYVRYISNDAAYGNDMSMWPKTFTRWAEVYLASRVCEVLTQNSKKAEKLKKAADPEAVRPSLLVEARSKDAMNEPSQQPALGTWTRARRQARFRSQSW